MTHLVITSGKGSDFPGGTVAGMWICVSVSFWKKKRGTFHGPLKRHFIQLKYTRRNIFELQFEALLKHKTGR